MKIIYKVAVIRKPKPKFPLKSNPYHNIELKQKMVSTVWSRNLWVRQSNPKVAGRSPVLSCVAVNFSNVQDDGLQDISIGENQSCVAVDFQIVIWLRSPLMKANQRGSDLGLISGAKYKREREREKKTIEVLLKMGKKDFFNFY